MSKAVDRSRPRRHPSGNPVVGCLRGDEDTADQIGSQGTES